MKVIVKTAEGINLIDPHTRVVIKQSPILTPWTEFLNKHAARGHIVVLASQLPDTADAAEFQEYLKDAENEELAVEAFKASLAVEEPKPAPAKKPASTKKSTPAKKPAAKAEE